MLERAMVVVSLLVLVSFGVACGDLDDLASGGKGKGKIKIHLPDIDLGDCDWYDYFDGTTWTVENKTGDDCYEGYDAQITFGPEGTATLDYGRIAALGMAEVGIFVIRDVEFEILQGPTALFRWTMAGDTSIEYSTVIHIHFADTDKMIWVGMGGWGEDNCARASILRMVEEDPCN